MEVSRRLPLYRQSPIAEEALKRMGELYAIEAEANSLSADAAIRRDKARPIHDDLKAWL